MRVLLTVATLPLLAGYAAVAALLAVVAALATQASFSPGQILLAAAPGWLGAHQVPLTLSGEPLAMLPMALTVLLGVLIARSAAGAVERLDGRRTHRALVIVSTMACAHAVAGVGIAIASYGARLSADPLESFFIPGLVAAAAATLGLVRPCGLIAALRPYLVPVATAGLRAGLLGLVGLLAAGSAVFAIASVLSAPQAQSLFTAGAPGFGSGLGMLLLCLAYVPNAALAAVGFVVGPGFSFGDLQLSPYSYSTADVPAVPLLAALPDGPADWWRALVILPLGVGVLVGLRLRKSSPSPLQRLRSVFVAGAVVGFGIVVLGALASGRIGTSGGLMLDLGAVSLASFCWVAIPAAVVAYFAGERPRKRAEPKSQHDEDTADEETDEPESEAEDEKPDQDAKPETEDEEPAESSATDQESEPPKSGEPQPEEDEQAESEPTADDPDEDAQPERL
ncbi:DUF6350 family protein [Thermocrispum municipale]|uniref:cell division protein PerM n=1 Tax=Thermocrispum municipale TaxID=37926 RepID=UPI0003FF98FB|nr:DUF6350 family protein [Thermocrispum municipale]